MLQKVSAKLKLFRRSTQYEALRIEENDTLRQQHAGDYYDVVIGNATVDAGTLTLLADQVCVAGKDIRDNMRTLTFSTDEGYRFTVKPDKQNEVTLTVPK